MPRLGKKKTALAVEHSILLIAYHVLTRRAPYSDLARSPGPNGTIVHAEMHLGPSTIML
jgi:hypothetical protein